MKKIGITGGIGSGKTLVAGIFSVIGIPVYNADTRAKWITNNDTVLKEQIIACFGESAYDENGMYNSVFMSKMVFNNPDKLALLNQLIHPRVSLDFGKWCLKYTDKDYVLKEAALFFESGTYQELDAIITVTGNLDTRIARILARDPQRSREQILQIMDRQLPDSEKTTRSTFVINNNESVSVIAQVNDIHFRITHN